MLLIQPSGCHNPINVVVVVVVVVIYICIYRVHNMHVLCTCMYCTTPLSPRKGRLTTLYDDDDDDDDEFHFNNCEHHNQIVMSNIASLSAQSISSIQQIIKSVVCVSESVSENLRQNLSSVGLRFPPVTILAFTFTACRSTRPVQSMAVYIGLTITASVWAGAKKRIHILLGLGR